MRLKTLMVLFSLSAGVTAAQTALPLESVAVEGSKIPEPVILQIAGLHLASPIDKAKVEDACKKLQDSGLFSSITYRAAAGPKHGYAVTLVLADQAPLIATVIDVPGIDEEEAWRWLAAKFGTFDHQVPQVDAGQQFLARSLEQHLAGGLHGQSLAVRLNADLATGHTSLSFEPSLLPRIQSVTFTGNEMVSSAELSSALSKIVAQEGYTDRRFAGFVELNLRPVYEERGLYRVQFKRGNAQRLQAGISVNVAIQEGAPYQLGEVQLVGDNLPVENMLAAAKLAAGKLANWKEIQKGIWEMERVVRRTGYIDTVSVPARVYDDPGHILNLRIRVIKGPLHHFGELQIMGLSPELQEKARRTWRPKPGDPYDYSYPNEFFQAFSRAVDFRGFQKYNVQTRPGAGDHVININLVFEPR